MDDGGGGGGAGDTATLKLKGLPFSANEGDISQFFSGFALVGAYVLMDPDGRPSGMGFAEFNSPEEARRAMVRDRAYIGERFVKLIRVPRHEMESQLGATGFAPPKAGGGGNLPPPQQQQQQPPPMHMQQRNAPQQANVNVQQQQHQQPTVAYQQPQGMAGMHQQGLAFGAGGFGGFGAGAFGGAFGAPHSFMGFGGGGVMDGVSMGGGLGGNGLGGGGGMGGMGEQPTYMAMGGVVGEPGFGGVVSGNFHSEAPAGMQAVSVGGQGRQQMQQPAPHMQQQQQQAQHAPQQQQHHGGGAPRRRPMGNGPALGVTRGLTVKMRGLPFRVQEAEVMQFFAGFAVVPSSFQMGSDHSGRPSGEGWITFSSAAEAERAVAQRNREYLGSRYLELTLV